MNLYRHGVGKYDLLDIWNLKALLMDRQAPSCSRVIDNIVQFPTIFFRGEDARDLFDRLLSHLLEIEDDAWVMSLKRRVDKDVQERVMEKLQR